MEEAYIDGEPGETDRGWVSAICVPGIDGNLADVYGESKEDCAESTKQILDALTLGACLLTGALDPCPFCKTRDLKLSGFHGTLSAMSEVYVECRECGAKGPVVEFEHRKGQTKIDTRSAIHWWNTRLPTK